MTVDTKIMSINLDWVLLKWGGKINNESSESRRSKYNQAIILKYNILDIMAVKAKNNKYLFFTFKFGWEKILVMAKVTIKISIYGKSLPKKNNINNG